ncbi:Heat shock 70 kDa protein 12A [Pseudocercospora fuligena]|uniref:Heat shock 70 kDa protein 12A n=1 Tax=Pseudocercospora fuligena TaxID=685502 RepID=A0A8H6VRW8_9PEZI|nr:Heat shock 70 kDa protein 12A [Pseudocercospora fuligena]
MSSTTRQPDLLVGIDLGQTCTGVAYALPQQGDNIRWIQRWPGRAQANENKLRKPSEQDPNYGQLRDWFKTLLDPKNLDAMRERDPDLTTTQRDVWRWYRDFLRRVYNHIEQKLSSELPNFEWSAAQIEFLFSVPTTWSPQVVEMFRSIIGQSGFGDSTNARHSVIMSLTEAEAAAVHMSTEAASQFREGDVLVVCDAGGGTTDISALEITETMTEMISLKQLRQVDVVGGRNIGSVGIDFAFQKQVEAKLKLADSATKFGIDPEEAAWEMAKGRDFQNVKCEHGSSYEPPRFSVPVQHLDLNHVSEEAKISRGEMHFDKEELRGLFDHQIDKLFRMIDRQLHTLRDKLPERQVSHLILSGGLGQSPYVQQRLIEHYRMPSRHLSNTESMQIRVAPDPQLAVCKGLVADRLRKLKSGQSVLRWRCCRASYGLLCKEIFNPENVKHHERRTSIDARDGKMYVNNCIAWFVKKGSPISIDQPIVHDFKRKVAPGDPRKAFPTKIVVSYVEKNLLPYVLDDSAEQLCEVEADLSLVDKKCFKEKKKRFWQRGEHHLVVEFQVQVAIGPADLRFELWFDGQRMSKEHSIKVEWAPATAPLPSFASQDDEPPEGPNSKERPNFHILKV